MWCEPSSSRLVGYCRVSSKKQASSLDSQEQLIKARFPEAEIIREVGSGFNFKRRKLKALLEQAMSGAKLHIVVTTEDRLARAAFPLLKWIFELQGGTVTTLEGDISSDKFDAGTLLAFLTSFCASLIFQSHR
ncbi:MAG: hypothetical protein KatS3mg109_0122 [Pirellulaceae bacterium]|nr:MAG: hypothetical protein KatS3mg109_0122 [Pirellulaceae bacterium]